MVFCLNECLFQILCCHDVIMKLYTAKIPSCLSFLQCSLSMINDLFVFLFFFFFSSLDVRTINTIMRVVNTKVSKGESRNGSSMIMRYKGSKNKKKKLKTKEIRVKENKKNIDLLFLFIYTS